MDLASFGSAGDAVREWLRMSFGLVNVHSDSFDHHRSPCRHRDSESESEIDVGLERQVRRLVSACVPDVVLVRGQGPRFGVSSLLKAAAAHVTGSRATEVRTRALYSRLLTNAHAHQGVTKLG